MSGGKLIAVDIGNSSTKLGWFDDIHIGAGLPKPSRVLDFPTGQPPPGDLAAELGDPPIRWRVASVNRAGQQALSEWIAASRPGDDFHVLSHTDLPIAVRVDYPERVGLDRLAAAVAANSLREPYRAAIVIDAGTAVTVDLVSSDGSFEGGVILAGFRMQSEVLHLTADLLPLALWSPGDDPPAVVGKNTEGAIRSGLFWGTVGAVRELIAGMTTEVGQTPQVVVTGGALERLAPLVGGDTRFVPHMVLAGIAIAARREQPRQSQVTERWHPGLASAATDSPSEFTPAAYSPPASSQREPSLLASTPSPSPTLTVSVDRVLKLARVLKGFDSHDNRSLEQYLSDIPRLEKLSKVASGTPVLIRGDLDAKPGPSVGQGDIRLRSMQETLEFGRKRGWKQVIFGHLGRKEKDKPIGSLAKVASRLEKILGCEVPVIVDWLDEQAATVKEHVRATIAAAAPGSVLMLQNARSYDLETALWDATADTLPRLTPRLATLASSLAEKVASVYVNEALSAGSLDASTTIVPLAMKQVALGQYVAREFAGPMLECLKARLVVFSGIKIDKLDDLEAIIARGTVRTIFSAGSLAMALKKAESQLTGRDFALGVAEDPAHKGKPYYIPPERIEQAQRMLLAGKKQGIEFVLPIDFKLGDQQVVESLGPAAQQFDIGPKTIALFERKVGEFIDAFRMRQAVVFHNGVFGMFEDPRFEAGTKAFMTQLKRMKDTGLAVYVGGGEGGTALEQYGKPDWVTHCFTAGGTVLNVLGAQPVPYLVALRAAATGS